MSLSDGVKVIKEPALHSVGSLKNLQSIKTYISSENYVLISMFKCSTQILYLQIFFAFIFRNRWNYLISFVAWVLPSLKWVTFMQIPPIGAVSFTPFTL